MRKIIAEVCVSLNGYIDGPDGELGWIRIIDKPSYIEMLGNKYDTIFYGRKAYQKMINVITDDLSNVVEPMRKYVFSNSFKHLEGNAMVVHSNFHQEVERIRDEEGLDIWLCGGATMIKTFAQNNLIDEFLIYVHPVILHGGTQLFSFEPALQLKSCEQLDSGIVRLNYEVIKNNQHG
jgi:dihydrofolate reductase